MSWINRKERIVEEYDSLSWLYEVLYAGYNKAELGQAFLDEHAELFSRNKFGKFHDASCGNGVQAVTLRARGYEISASDISEEMLNLTRAYAQEKQVDLHTFRSGWRELHQHMEDKVDVMLCVGNSISHTRDYTERVATLQQFYAILNEGGTLLLDTRNWDLMTEITLKYSVLKQREYKEKKYVPIYIWDPLQFEKESLLRLVFIEFSGEGQSEYERRITFTPFSHNSLLEACRDTGFKVEKDTFNMEDDRYYIYLKK